LLYFGVVSIFIRFDGYFFDMEITHVEGFGSSNFDAIIQSSSLKIQKIARLVRQLIAKIYPGIVEVVWEKQRMAGYGIGPKKMSEQFGYLGIFKNHVNLGFYYGTQLSDPSNLIEGTGKNLRHIKIRHEADINNPEIKILIEKALEHVIEANK
jgi:hypothetical protein